MDPNEKGQTHIIIGRSAYFFAGKTTYENEKNIIIEIGNQWHTKYEHLLLGQSPITIRNYKENIDETGTRNS